MKTQVFTGIPVEIITLTLNSAMDQTVIIRDFAAGKVNRIGVECAGG